MSKVSICVGLVLLLTVVARPPAPAHAQAGITNVSGAGLAGLAGLAVFDIYSAPLSAQRYNEKQAQLSLAMNLHDASPGLTLRFSFNRARALRTGFVHRYTPRAPSFARQEKMKSGAAAFLWSLGATVAPVALGYRLALDGTSNEGGLLLMTGGMVLGPSVGHWYAEQAGRGWITVGLRFLMVVVFFAGYDYSVLSNGCPTVPCLSWGDRPDGLMMILTLPFPNNTIKDSTMGFSH